MNSFSSHTEVPNDCTVSGGAGGAVDGHVEPSEDEVVVAFTVVLDLPFVSLQEHVVDFMEYLLGVVVNFVVVVEVVVGAAAAKSVSLHDVAMHLKEPAYI